MAATSTRAGSLPPPASVSPLSAASATASSAASSQSPSLVDDQDPLVRQCQLARPGHPGRAIPAALPARFAGDRQPHRARVRESHRPARPAVSLRIEQARGRVDRPYRGLVALGRPARQFGDAARQRHLAGVQVHDQLKRVSIRVGTIWERDSLFSFEVPASGARGFFALFSRSGSKAQSGSPVSNTDRRPESRLRVSPWGIQFAQLPAVEVADAAGWAAAGGPGVRSR